MVSERIVLPGDANQWEQGRGLAVPGSSTPVRTGVGSFRA